MLKQLLILVSFSVGLANSAEQIIMHKTNIDNSFSIATNWEALGPFQSGTREQQWGADPLEACGGFHNIAFTDSKPFTSALNGSVYFTKLTASSLIVKDEYVSRRIPVVFPDVNWGMLEKTFGWSALQFQAWIRGTVEVHSEGRYGVWIGNAVEFYLDGIFYDVGNLYDPDILLYNRGGLFLHLSSGQHILEIRVVNDIRAFGGQIPPKVDVHLALRKVTEDLVLADHRSHGGWIVPTVIEPLSKHSSKHEGCLTGEWASFALRNEGRKWIVIVGLRVDEVSQFLKALTTGRIGN